jgi:hypothetical protein
VPGLYERKDLPPPDLPAKGEEEKPNSTKNCKQQIFRKAPIRLSSGERLFGVIPREERLWTVPKSERKEIPGQISG